MDMRSLIHQGLAAYHSSSTNSMGSSSSSSSATVSSSNSSFPAPIVSSALPVPSFTVMRPQPNLFQRAAEPSAVSQAPTLAPLRFIIPNGNAFTHNGTNVAAPVPSTAQSTFNRNEPEHEPQTQHSMMYPQNRYAIKKEKQQQQLLSTVDDLKQSKKMTSKRSRTPKLSSRSTKSKARPGLRKGKWTKEESCYATQLTNYFKEGLLPLERGTMLRLYLSQKLNCEPMRITKKFTGGECIGKQVFRPCSVTPESRVKMMQAQLELVTLEAAFIKRLKENREDPPVSTDDFDVRPISCSSRSRSVPLKPRIYESGDDDDKEGDVEDANAVGLLLDFFYKANRNHKKGDKKAAFTNKDATEDMKTEIIEGEHMKKEPADIHTPLSPTTNSESDTSMNSPTKRMRALSVSGCVDPAASKRSRVGSFSTVTAA